MPESVSYKSPPQKIKRVWTDNASAINEGAPWCYDWDNGTAASVDADRFLTVEQPSTTNNHWFAGVARQGYAAKTGGQWIDIVEPGSVANVWTDQNCTIGTTRITAKAGTSLFYTQGFPGRGTAQCLQTIDRSSTAGLCQAYLYDGPQSGLVESVTPANGAMTIMTHGITYFPATTIGTGDATYTLADGTLIDQRKGFILEGAMTTNDIVVTVTTVQIIAAVAVTGYDVCTMDAAGEHLIATWNGKGWEVQGSVLA